MSFRIRDVLVTFAETVAFFGAMIAIYYSAAFFAVINAPVAQ
jgi:hypothetical protein